MDLWTIGIPATVALGAVAVLGYLFGRRRNQGTAEYLSARRELKRAKAIVRDLEKIAQQVRCELAQHHSSVTAFKHRVLALGKSPDEVDWKQLSTEAEKMLGPTKHLAAQIAHAYDMIRQQSTQLMSFSELRTDPLTGLNNRRALDETLSHSFALKERYGNPFSIVIYDIDNFSQLNQDLGHVQGDKVLQQLAAVLDEYVRETDIAVRFGGEEFICVLPSTNLEGACTFAERMRATVQKLCTITVSGGIAEAVLTEDPGGLIARADAALYAAKSEGRNRVFQHSGNSIEPVYSTESQLAHGAAAPESVCVLSVCNPDDSAVAS